MSYRKKNILGAAALAVLAVIFMLLYISKAHSGNAEKTKKPAGRVAVLVARYNIKPGTPGNALGHGSVVTRMVATDAVPVGAFTSAASLHGLVVRREIPAGRTLSERQFGPASNAGVRIELRGRERVVELAGEAGQVLDGTLRRGDHVDVVATWNVPESCTQCHVSGTIVRNALVLATSAELGKGSSGSTQSSIPVQLRLTDAQARRVFWITKNGEWWLELRPVVHPRSSGHSLDNARTILANAEPKERSNP
jgi:Flp pilus assembly protein CpaB